MEIKEIPQVFHVEPPVYTNEYNTKNHKDPFKEKIRFEDNYCSTYNTWKTTVYEYKTKPFADGFLRYEHE